MEDLRRLLAHHRSELHQRTQTATSSSANSLQSGGVSPSHGGTPSRALSRVRGLLTPSKGDKKAGAIPTTLVHSDSSGNVSTWLGNANPSLTGDGVSVLFENVEQRKKIRTSRLLAQEDDQIVMDPSEEAESHEDTENGPVNQAPTTGKKRRRLIDSKKPAAKKKTRPAPAASPSRPATRASRPRLRAQ